jgi:Rieske Fe-S protein
MSDGFVKIGKVADFAPNKAPIDVTSIVQAVAPSAVPRMLTRFSDAANGSPTFAAVASICTHRGCPVLTGDGVWGSTDQPIYDPATRIITCPCHDSQFNVATGALLRGPATTPLLSFATEVRDSDIFVAISAGAPAPLRSASPAVTQARPGADGLAFPGTGHRYLVDFGAFLVELYFESPDTLTYTSIRRDGTRGPSETVKIETTYLRDSLFMVTWQEADRTTVVHVEDYDQFVIHTNITNPDHDHTFQKFRGTFRLIR